MAPSPPTSPAPEDQSDVYEHYELQKVKCRHCQQEFTNPTTIVLRSHVRLLHPNEVRQVETPGEAVEEGQQESASTSSKKRKRKSDPTGTSTFTPPPKKVSKNFSVSFEGRKTWEEFWGGNIKAPGSHMKEKSNVRPVRRTIKEAMRSFKASASKDDTSSKAAVTGVEADEIKGNRPQE